MAAALPSSAAAVALGAAAAAAACLCGARRCATLSSSASARARHTPTGGGASDKFEMKSVGLVALDLDGTLCRSDGTVSARNCAALAALRRQGVTVVMATGRPGQLLLPAVLAKSAAGTRASAAATPLPMR